MKRLFILPMLLVGLDLLAQKTVADDLEPVPEKIIKENVAMEGASRLSLEFPYAGDIRLHNTDGNEIEVYVNAMISDGQNNEVYELLIDKEGDRIFIGSDQKRLDDFFKKSHSKKYNYCYRNEITVEISIPKDMTVDVESISADVTGELRSKSYTIKTIAGDIDLTVPDRLGAEVYASTISGAMYADVELDHLDGKEGLRQIVGEKIHVNVNNGGEAHHLETISGDVMLRAGE